MRKNPTKALASPDAAALRIVTAARAHFFRFGFRSVTMDDLAAQLGMSKKTFYVHFKSKRKLLEAVIAQKLGQLEAEMAAVDAKGDFSEILFRLLHCMRRQAQEITAPFVRDMAREDPSLMAMIKAKRRDLIGKTFGRILRTGQQSQAIRSDIPADLLVETLLGAVDALVTPENLAAKEIPASELLSTILSVFLYGTLTEEGRKS